MQPQLSKEQLQFYNDNGYLVLGAQEHNLVADPSKLKVWAEQVRNWPLDKGKWMPYFEVTSSGSRQQMRTENFVDYHDEWSQLLHGNGLASILKQLSGEVCGSCTSKFKGAGLTDVLVGHDSVQGQDQLQVAQWKRIPGAC
jgi:hypothetical protein